jgi:hypothetical protein
MTEVRRKPISGELRNLGIGGVATFPIEQRSSVISVINKLRKELIRNGWNCTMRDNLSKYQVEVTRIR